MTKAARPLGPAAPKRPRGQVAVPAMPISKVAIPKAAIAAYRRLPFSEQIQLVEEIIRTRADELLAAHPGVIGLGLGMRRRRDRRGVLQTSREVLHLRFMVKRKWDPPPRGTLPRQGHIPSHLLIGIGPLAARTLVAVPTDVEARPPRHTLKRQSTAIRAWTGPSYAEGTLTCVLQENKSGGRRYLGLSCRHVLSPTGNPGGLGPPASQVDEATDPPARLGAATSLRGSMSNPAKLDFDAQLLAFEDDEVAAAVVSDGLSLPGTPVSATAQLLGNVELWASSSATPLAVAFHTWWTFPGPVVPGLLDHRQVLEMTLTGAHTEPGDSGSPLVLGGAVPALAGMHIALRPVGSEFISLCIPAWDLLNPVLYGIASNPPQWRVM